MFQMNKHKYQEYRWTALDKFAQKQKGTLFAKDIFQAEQELLSKEYTQIKLKKQLVLFNKPKNKEINVALIKLALLVNAKVDFKKALLMTRNHCRNLALYQCFDEMIDTINRGFSFSFALNEAQQLLTTQEIQLIEMGEKTGRLAFVLNKIVDNRTKLEKTAKKVKKILYYPVFILVVAFAMTLLMLIYVVPNFKELYQNVNDIPFITQLLFFISDGIAELSVTYSGLILFLSVLCFKYAKKSEGLQKSKQKIVMALPLFKQIIMLSNRVYFFSNLYLMLNSGLTIDKALGLFLSDKQRNFALKEDVERVLGLLKKGFGFSVGLNPALFGEDNIQMLKIAEQSSQLTEMLAFLSNETEEELNDKIEMISQLIEPALMLVIGSIIAVILVGLYLPIFNMGATV